MTKNEDSNNKKDLISKANDIAFKRMTEADPKLEALRPAKEAISGMEDRVLLHSGPPLGWEQIQGTTRSALAGAMMYEGWAKDPEEAWKKLDRGFAKLESCYDHNCVGAMAGVISPSMPVFVVGDDQTGKKITAFATINEGLGKVLRFGGLSDEVFARLKWIERTLAPCLAQVLDSEGPIKLRPIISAAIRRGDEVHNRNTSATSIAFMEIAPKLVSLDIEKGKMRECLDFIASNPHFFLSLSMCSAKIMALSARGIQNSTIVTAMISNGVEFGITVSGTGDRWYKAPAQMVQGKYFKGFSEEDASRHLGDSPMIETVGYGAFALAAAPAIVSFIGATAEYAIEVTERMRKICHGTNPNFVIPSLNYAGTPTGIDIIKVCETGIVPVMDAAMAHKSPGIGQIGAGTVSAPMACFEEAYEHFLGHPRQEDMKGMGRAVV